MFFEGTQSIILLLTKGQGLQMTKLTKQNVIIETFGNCTDLRITGSNLDTGKKAFFHVRGKNQGYKIYMTNTGKSIDLYIKQKGKNVQLQNDTMVGHFHPNKLIQLTDWYIETWL